MLKLHTLLYGQDHAGLFLDPIIHASVIYWEIGLGLWLVSGLRGGASNATAQATFLAFATLSLLMWYRGEASCGCFGEAVRFPPLYAFTIDLAALALLSFDGMKPHRADIALSLSVILTFFAMFGVQRYMPHEMRIQLAAATGSRLIASPSYLPLGQGIAYQRFVTQIRIHNLSDSPATLLGHSGNCSFDITDSLPLVVQPRSYATLNVVAIRSQQLGRFVKSIDIYTDVEGQPKLQLLAAGRNVSKVSNISVSMLTISGEYDD